MPSPSESQRAFVAALHDPEASPPPGVAGRADEIPKRRFDVYRNNVHAGLVDVLEARFPVVARLVGEDFFRAMARAFVATVLPQSPVMIHYGGSFAGFIDVFPPVEDLPYLGDVARLEWAWHEAYNAADAEPLPADRLAGVLQAAGGDHLGRLRAELLPSARIVRSRWAVLEIWHTNTHDERVRPIPLDGGGVDVLVLRPQWEVLLWRLPDGAADFVAGLTAGQSLYDAANRVAGEVDGFDLAAALQILIAAGAFTHLVEPEDGAAGPGVLQ